MNILKAVVYGTVVFYCSILRGFSCILFVGGQNIINTSQYNTTQLNSNNSSLMKINKASF